VERNIEHAAPPASLRIAIVGCGPKGTFALERLLGHAERAGASARLEVDLFEMHRIPAAGPVYDPFQPDYLRMNFAAEQIDMWWPEDGVVAGTERLSFCEWAALAGREQVRDAYPARAEVGEYLSDGFRRLLAHCPSNVDLAVHRTMVTAIRRERRGWKLESEGAGAACSSAGYDEILLASGHPREARRVPEIWQHRASLIPAVFPVERQLSPGLIAPGASVAVRGFALTFIDAALALTEGRGGVFRAHAGSSRLQYEPSGQQVGLILPFSRSGRPMLAKPEPSMLASVAELEEIAERGRGRLLATGRDLSIDADLLGLLASTASASLLIAQGLPSGGERELALSRRMLTRLRRSVSEPAVACAREAVGEIERSLAVGRGELEPDDAWALGHAWRALYPALVTRVSGHPLQPQAWPAFHRLAREMERLAFGPSPVNAAKLLALIEAGVVSLRHVSGASLESDSRETRLCSGLACDPVGVVVDAVLAPPGADGGLSGDLLRAGHARLLAGARGLEVRHDGSCVGANGELTPGLAAIGRVTEDSVIGNDTLSRTLHPLSDHWARRVVTRASAPVRTERAADTVLA
jgi:uncharacterized NAD(P)/FAD-binding protein YdhS